MSETISFSDDPLAATPLVAGNLEVRLAQSVVELEASQALRYQVFVGEIGAIPTSENKSLQRDIDVFDEVCDHLLAVETLPDGEVRVVGSYRLLRRKPMERVGAFYSASEYDLTTMHAYDGNVLELGRSCVHPDYRNRAVMQLLFRGITAYVEKHDIDIMFGCGSLYGADVELHKETLSYLYHYHLAPEDLRIRALPERFERMDLMAKEAIEKPARVFAGLPPLIKGYLRMGGYVGDGAVLDPEYNTTDIAIIVKTQTLDSKYVDRYASDALKESIRSDDS